MNVQVDQSFMVNPQAENADVAVDFMEYWLTQGIAWSEISQMPLNLSLIHISHQRQVHSLWRPRAALHLHR